MTKLIGTNSQFDDNNKKFTYAVYVSGEYLDKHVDATRTDFDLPDEGLFCDSETPIAKDKLQNEIAEKVYQLNENVIDTKLLYPYKNNPPVNKNLLCQQCTKIDRYLYTLCVVLAWQNCLFLLDEALSEIDQYCA